MGQGEVEALQGLAAAHGGMLTTNPQTGLPEAGFLSKILPMVAGAALAPLTAGTSLAFLGASPLAAGLTVGGLSGLAQGNIMKGVKDGLSAFGGAGIGNALSSLGTEAAGALSPDVAAKLSTAYGAGEGNAASALLAAQPSATEAATAASPLQTMLSGANVAARSPGAFVEALGPNAMKYGLAAASPFAMSAMEAPKEKEIPEDTDPGTEYDFDPGTVSPTPDYDPQGRGQRYFNPRYTPRTTSRFARGGISDGLSSAESHLGSYSAGGRGRLLRGPGDGVSDSIPATIGGKQPARLADGEFVIPARIVSELGNGSTEAGAKQLYAMMDRIQRARRKTTGKQQVAKNTKAHKLMPA
jgi:hypothetical protein